MRSPSSELRNHRTPDPRVLPSDTHWSGFNFSSALTVSIGNALARSVSRRLEDSGISFYCRYTNAPAFDGFSWTPYNLCTYKSVGYRARQPSMAFIGLR